MAGRPFLYIQSTQIADETFWEVIFKRTVIAKVETEEEARAFAKDWDKSKDKAYWATFAEHAGIESG